MVGTAAFVRCVLIGVSTATHPGGWGFLPPWLGRSPALTISKVLLSICSLLCDPNPRDPLVRAATPTSFWDWFSRGGSPALYHLRAGYHLPALLVTVGLR